RLGIRVRGRDDVWPGAAAILVELVPVDHGDVVAFGRPVAGIIRRDGKRAIRLNLSLRKNGVWSVGIRALQNDLRAGRRFPLKADFARHRKYGPSLFTAANGDRETQCKNQRRTGASAGQRALWTDLVRVKKESREHGEKTSCMSLC